MTSPPKMQRDVLADGLRAAALLGVFIVNGLGYVDAPNQIPIGLPRPEESSLAYGIHMFVFAIFQGKAYPLLSFLLGYSMALSWRMSSRNGIIDAISARRSRDIRMLTLGILHGAFIYFGDILTIYAIAGLISAPWLASASKILRKKWWLLLKINIFINGLLAFFLFWSVSAPVSTPGEELRISTFFGHLTWAEFLVRNFIAYVYQQMSGLLLTLPLVLWLIVTGILASRMRLLGASRRAYRWVQARWSMLGLCASLVANVCSAALVLHDPKATSLAGKFAAVIMMPAGVALMLFSLGGGIVLWQQHQRYFCRILIFIAPAGRYGLSMYLMGSFSLLVTSGAILNWPTTSIQAVMMMSLIYFFCILCARFANASGWRGPLEAWLSGKRIQ
jgi:uncharacterized protein